MTLCFKVEFVDAKSIRHRISIVIPEEVLMRFRKMAQEPWQMKALLSLEIDLKNWKRKFLSVAKLAPELGLCVSMLAFVSLRLKCLESRGQGEPFFYWILNY